ncbi:MAG TPA: hypothetical protein VKB31_03915 [Trueperaceae bacterium]|nr:hypothetical protein [Trueperaceae bacterium]
MPGDPTATTPPPQHVLVGRLGRTYQLEGGLRLQLAAGGGPAAVRAGARVFVVGYGPAAVREVRPLAGSPVLYLEGVRDRDSARALTGAEVYLPDSAVVASEQGPATAATAQPDLAGAEVRLGDRVIGRVREVRAAGANPLLVVEGADGSELLLPLAAPYVQVAAGRVRLVDPPAGLLAP